MRHQLQPNNWSCLPTAFANLLDINVQEIFDFLGHDGSKKVFKEWEYQHEPKTPREAITRDCVQRQAFHVQEMVRFCLTKRVLVCCIETYPVSTNSVEELKLPNNKDLIIEAAAEFEGVFTGEIRGMPHAVTWDMEEQRILDPNGQTYDIGKFTIEAFYLTYQI